MSYRWAAKPLNPLPYSLICLLYAKCESEKFSLCESTKVCYGKGHNETTWRMLYLWQTKVSVTFTVTLK